MKKPNRRSKRTSVADSSSPPAIVEAKRQEQQQFDRRVDDLEKQNEALKMEIEELKQKLYNVSPNSIEKPKDYDHSEKFHALEEQVMELKKKLNERSQVSAQKQKSSQKNKNGEAEISLQDEIQRLKAQKVQLLCKIKLESVHFRFSKASLEKEVLQLKKEQRRNHFEMRKLLALNEKQKMVLQRKTEEASLATKRLKDLLDSHKSSGFKSATNNGIQGVKLELKIAERVEEIRSEYERQMEEMADEVRKFEEEAEMLRQENFRCLLQDKEAHCMVKDSELRDLKEEVVRLSNLVNQLGAVKTRLHIKKLDVAPVKSSVSAGSSIVFADTSESEFSGANNAGLGKSTRVCCSCSKKSLCKTSKCECRAALGSCGTGCGCAASKCTNRVLSIKVDDSLRREVTPDSVHFSGTSETEKGVITSHPAVMDNDCAPTRKPLHEIGNILVNSSPTKPGLKTRRQKPAQENGEGPKDAEMDNPMRLTRARRSTVSVKNS